VIICFCVLFIMKKIEIFFSATCYSVRSRRQKAVTANRLSGQTIDAHYVKLISNCLFSQVAKNLCCCIFIFTCMPKLHIWLNRKWYSLSSLSIFLPLFSYLYIAVPVTFPGPSLISCTASSWLTHAIACPLSM